VPFAVEYYYHCLKVDVDQLTERLSNAQMKQQGKETNAIAVE
jgi:hypothetical protein